MSKLFRFLNSKPYNAFAVALFTVSTMYRYGNSLLDSLQKDSTHNYGFYIILYIFDFVITTWAVYEGAMIIFRLNKVVESKEENNE